MTHTQRSASMCFTEQIPALRALLPLGRHRKAPSGTGFWERWLSPALSVALLLLPCLLPPLPAGPKKTGSEGGEISSVLKFFYTFSKCICTGGPAGRGPSRLSLAPLGAHRAFPCAAWATHSGWALARAGSLTRLGRGRSILHVL